ncbi:hypothetical protein HDV02_001881 [Globomyces sp. JEL0801]|nr:hypothetical protein HDV02_001881 [Globomyces sp. JEL0801]
MEEDYSLIINIVLSIVMTSPILLLILITCLSKCWKLDDIKDDEKVDDTNTLIGDLEIIEIIEDEIGIRNQDLD